jgi:hypothetical protein
MQELCRWNRVCYPARRRTSPVEPEQDDEICKTNPPRPSQTVLLKRLKPIGTDWDRKAKPTEKQLYFEVEFRQLPDAARAPSRRMAG